MDGQGVRSLRHVLWRHLGFVLVNWAGSTRRARLPKDWPARVKAVRKRDRDTCYVCGGKRCGNRNIEVDHVQPGDDHRLENLATIGRACHSTKTSREAHANRLSTKRKAEPHPGLR